MEKNILIKDKKYPNRSCFIADHYVQFIDYKAMVDVNEAKEILKDIDFELIRGSLEEEAIVKRNNKKILIGCREFWSLTGMPMYILYLVKGLIALNWDIDIVAGEIRGIPMEEVKKLGVRVFNFNDPEYQSENYEWLILNEPESECLYEKFPNTPAINIVHSKYDCEKPHQKRPQLRQYLACRQDVLDFWKPMFPFKWDILNNPIDFDRFKKIKAEKDEKKKKIILSASTIDFLRKPMLLDLVNKAKKDKKIEVIIKGKDYGALKDVKLPKNVKILDWSLDVENDIAKADIVAGIYVGRITLEAMAMGKETWVYDADGTYVKGIIPKNFKEDFNYNNVAKKLNNIINEKWADIIIPHHNKHDLLAECLSCISLRNFNIVVVAGSHFARGVNKGTEIAETDNLIILNDDTKFTPDILWKLLDSKKDIVGVPQKRPDGSLLCYGLCRGDISKTSFTIIGEKDNVLFPSGAMFRIKKELFKRLGGLDERFINGMEDVDLFVKAKIINCSMGIIDDFIIHHESQSDGRFKHCDYNEELFNKIYSKSFLDKLFI